LRSRNRSAQAAAMAVRSVLFPRIIKGWTVKTNSLTIFQNKECGQSVRDKVTTEAAIHRMHTE